MKFTSAFRQFAAIAILCGTHSSAWAAGGFLDRCMGLFRQAPAVQTAVPVQSIRAQAGGLMSTYQQLSQNGGLLAQDDSRLPRNTWGATCVPTSLANILLAAAEIENPGRISNLSTSQKTALHSRLMTETLRQYRQVVGVDGRSGLLGLDSIIPVVEPVSRSVPGLVIPNITLEGIHVPSIRIQDLVTQFATGRYLLMVAVTVGGGSSHAWTVTGVERQGTELTFQMIDPYRPNQTRRFRIHDTGSGHLELIDASTGQSQGTIMNALSVRLGTSEAFQARFSESQPVRAPIPQAPLPGYTAINLPFSQSFSMSGTISKSGQWVATQFGGTAFKVYRTSDVSRPVLETGAPAAIREMKFHEHAGQTYLIMTNTDNRMHIRNMATNSVESFPVFSRQNGGGHLSWHLFSPDKSTLLTVGIDPARGWAQSLPPSNVTITQFTVNGAVTQKFEDILPKFSGAAAMIDNNSFVLGDENGKIHFYDIRVEAGRMRVVKTREIQALDSGWVTGMTFIRGRQTLVAASTADGFSHASHSLALIDVATGNRETQYFLSEDAAELNANARINDQRPVLHGVHSNEGDDHLVIMGGHNGRESSHQPIIFHPANEFGGIGHNSGYRTTFVQGTVNGSTPFRAPNGQLMMNGGRQGLFTISDIENPRVTSVYYPGIHPGYELTYDPSMWSYSVTHADNGMMLIMTGWGAQLLVPEF